MKLKISNEEHGVWLARIQKCLSYQANNHRRWEDAIDLLNCDYFKKMYGGIDPERVDVHFINWYISNLVPLVYFRDPYIFCKPRNSKSDDFAETMEKLLNYYWKELSLKQQFKRAILSALIMPPGWIKLGYTAKIGQDISEIQKEKTKSFVQEIKNMLIGKEPKEKTKEQQGIINEYIEEENIFVDFVSSWNMLVPEGYNDVNKMPYLIEMEDIPKVDFMANPMYENKDSVEYKKTAVLIPQSKGTINTATYEEAGKDDETDIIRLFHIWDKRGNKRLTISAKDTHLATDWCYDCDGYPYEPLFFEESVSTNDKSNFYAYNVIDPILPQVLEQANARTQMCKHRKRASAIILAQRNLLTEEDLQQLTESDNIQIAYISNIGAVQMSQTPALPPDVYNVDNVIKQDLQMGTNMGSLMFQALQGQRTATQATIAQSGLQLKASARVDCVEDFTVKTARKMAQLLYQFYDREKVAEILGENITPTMWPDKPEDKNERKKLIKAELSFNIDAGSTAPPKDESVERKQLLDMVSVIASFAPERLRKGEVVSELIDTFKFVKEADRVVITNDEEEIVSAQKENQFMAQGLPQVVSANDLHDVHIQEHSKIPGDNPVRDQHIIEHGNFMGITPQGKAQKGDTRPPMKSTNPEMVRQGMTNQGDVYQSVQNLGVGTGPEAV